MVESPSGLILVTGPTGSGKSTTLASMVDQVNRPRRCHILTIEDPIEYVHEHGLGAVNQREVGADTDSFARGLRSALREDPDVLMVGEMRDLESIDTVLTMAETGHLVFATLHTNDTSQAIDRLVGVFPGEQQNQARLQLSACLVGVVYQRLIPKIGGGLVAAYEVLAGTHAVRNLIREGKTRQLRNAITMAQGEGMQTLEKHLSRLVADGVVSLEDAMLRSLYPKEIGRPVPPPKRAVWPGSGRAQPRGSRGRAVPTSCWPAWSPAREAGWSCPASSRASPSSPSRRRSWASSWRSSTTGPPSRSSPCRSPSACPASAPRRAGRRP